MAHVRSSARAEPIHFSKPSLIFVQIEGSSITSGPSIEGEQATVLAESNHVDSAGQAASLSSLEEITPGLAKRSRRRPNLDLDRQHSESSSWTVCEEDGGSERVRFDHHVSFIEADEENGTSSVSRGLGRRKRNKEHEQEDSQKTSRLNT